MILKHVVITGGAGFIGSHLCDAFLGRGYAVTAIDNLLTGSRENIRRALKNPNFFFIEWNISKPLPRAEIPFLKRHGLEGVLHFACPASPADFDRIPFDILEVDSLGTMYTVDLAMRYGARYLLASSSEVYGDPLVHPQKEDYFGNVNPVGPRACYDEAKRFAEAYVASAMRGRGSYKGGEFQPLNAAIVRIFNTYGPRMRPDDGRVIPEFCARALQGEPLIVHDNGEQTRSLCFVADLVDGVLRLFESDLREPVNLGSPDERTVLELAHIIRDLAGSRSEIHHAPARPEDPRRRRPDTSKAARLLKWKSRTGLHEGLRATLEHFRQQNSRPKLVPLPASPDESQLQKAG